MCPAWLVPAVKRHVKENCVFLPTVRDVKAFLTRWREMMEGVVKGREKAEASVAVGDACWHCACSFMGGKWNGVNTEEFCQQLLRTMKSVCAKNGMPEIASVLDRAQREVKGMSELYALCSSKELRKAVARDVVVELEARMKKEVRYDRVMPNPQEGKEKKRESPLSALEEEVHKELLRSKAFELEMNELGREPELDVLMNSLEIAESDVFY